MDRHIINASLVGKINLPKSGMKSHNLLNTKNKMRGVFFTKPAKATAPSPMKSLIVRSLGM